MFVHVFLCYFGVNKITLLEVNLLTSNRYKLNENNFYNVYKIGVFTTRLLDYQWRLVREKAKQKLRHNAQRHLGQSEDYNYYFLCIAVYAHMQFSAKRVYLAFVGASDVIYSVMSSVYVRHIKNDIT